MQSSLSSQYERLRVCVIGQSGYGMDSCQLCGAKWIRGNARLELLEHIDCIASPVLTKEKALPVCRLTLNRV